MSLVVFLGPTLDEESARAVLDASFLPPAAQGDVYRAARKKPDAIGIVDGFFEEVPAVWHKEILWAIKQGIPVFGASSMGALRAAELHPFGMVGVGRIFEHYRDGVLEADDEVALVHGPKAFGYVPFSEPMVNIRATLERAVADGVIEGRTHELLTNIGLGLHYKDRTYERILACASERGACPSRELARLAKWVKDHRVDQKREDALEMLTAMADLQPGQARPADFNFEGTELWRQLVRSVGADDGAGEEGAAAADPILTELRLLGTSYVEVLERAMARAIALALFKRGTGTMDPAAARECVTRFRREHALLDPGALEQWLQDNSLELREFVRLMDEDARIESVRRELARDAARRIKDCLRLDGTFATLEARARAKTAMFAEAPSDPVGGADEDALLRWFSRRVLANGSAWDRPTFASVLGFDDEQALIRAVHEDFLFEERKQSGAAS